MLQVAAWQLEALTDGLVPRERHDGTPWPAHIRPSDVGKELGVRCVVMYVKGDWAEFSKSMGLAGWGNTWQPCPICPVQKDAMHACLTCRVSEDGLQMPDRRPADYEVACGKCEKTVTVTNVAMRNEIWAALEAREKEGLVLKSNVHGLAAGDRLECSRELMVPTEFHEKSVPFRATFWRARFDCLKRCIDSVRHRCPLFSTRLGTSPARSLAIDTLHTVYLGIMMRITCAILMRLLWANPWDVSDAKRIQRLEADMFVYYDKKKIPHQNRVNLMTPKMMPNPNDPEHAGGILKLKASETYVVLKFAIYELEQFIASCDIYKGKELLEAARALVTWVQTVRESGACLTRDQYQTLLDCANRTLAYADQAGVWPTPKFHTFGHVTARSWRMGNPAVYDTFVDEALNLALRTCAERSHRSTMEVSVFICFGIMGCLNTDVRIFASTDVHPRYKRDGGVYVWRSGEEVPTADEEEQEELDDEAAA